LEHPGSLSELNGMISEDEDEDSDDSFSPIRRAPRLIRRSRRPVSDTVSRKVEKIPEDQEKNPSRKEDIIPLTDLECILSAPRVKGFDMSVKEWCMFSKPSQLLSIC